MTKINETDQWRPNMTVMIERELKNNYESQSITKNGETSLDDESRLLGAHIKNKTKNKHIQPFL